MDVVPIKSIEIYPSYCYNIAIRRLLHMDYQILRDIALKYADHKLNDRLPLDAKMIATNTGITLITKTDYCKNRRAKIPENVLALLVSVAGSPTIVYDDTSIHNNYPIAHEIAHYLLRHYRDGRFEESDAELLACILVAPSDLLIHNKYFNTVLISSECEIDIEIAGNYLNTLEKYDDEYHFAYATESLEERDANLERAMKKAKEAENAKTNKKLIILVSLYIIFFSLVFCGMRIYLRSIDKHYPEPIFSPMTEVDAQVYITKNGEKYHVQDCPYIKDKETISMTIEQAEEVGFEACKYCNPDK